MVDLFFKLLYPAMLYYFPKNIIHSKINLTSMKKVITLLIGLFYLSPMYAQISLQLDSTEVTVTTIANQLKVPWELIWGPDDHIWMTERDGIISRMNPETGEKQELYVFDDVVQVWESGLLGLALHPQFPETPYVYAVYNYMDSGAFKEKLVRLSYDGSNLSFDQVLLENIPGNTTHDGSRLAFLADGTLLMTTGDAQDKPAAQDTASLSGKILRMNDDGSIPSDNPFPNSLVYSWGHRNPQGLVIVDEIVYSSEHGPRNDDEVNIIEAGKNYGWPDVEGFCDNVLEESFCAENEVIPPLAAWTPTLAVAGLDYYNHPAIPEWQHSLLLVTLKAKQLVHLPLSEDGLSIIDQKYYFEDVGNADDPCLFTNQQMGRLRDLCIAPDGSVYISVSNRDRYGVPCENDDLILRLHNADYIDTGLEDEIRLSMSLYPNPSSDGRFLVSKPDEIDQAILHLYDAKGRLLLERRISQSETSIEYEGKGLFYVVVTGSDGVLYQDKVVLY